MNFIRLIAWKEFTQMRSDELTIRLMVLPVFIMMFVLGYAITTEVKNISITVVDRCNTPQSVSLVQSLIKNRLFVFAGYAASEENARQMLDRGEARIAVLVPPDFSQRLGRGDGADVGMLVDGQDANSSQVAAGYAQAIIGGWSTQQVASAWAARGVDVRRAAPVRVTPVILFNPMLKSTWYMIPALAVMLVTIITGLLTGFSLVREKESGTLEQLMVTPISPIHVAAGKVIPYVLIGLVELCLVLLLATLWFHVPFRGDFPTLLLFALVYMISSLGIGILVSTIARTPQQVLFMLWFVLIFFLLLSGLFLPLENMPHWVQTLTRINPLRYFMFILREMFLKGSTLVDLWKQGLSMLIIGLIFFSCALLAFNRKMG